MELRKLRISYLAEQFALQILAEHLGIAASEITHLTDTNDQAPHDLEHDGKRYDVKYSAPTSMAANDNTKVWDFSLRGKPKGSCDFFVLVGSKVGVFDSVYLVPEDVAPTQHLRIPLSGNSKWTAYKIWRPVVEAWRPPTKPEPKHPPFVARPAERIVVARRPSVASTIAVRDRQDLRTALEIFVAEGRASTSMLQRRMSIGYGRASRLLDKLRQLGLIEKPAGSYVASALANLSDEQMLARIGQREN